MAQGFSAEATELRAHAVRFLDAKCRISDVRHMLDGRSAFDNTLWKSVAEMGWLGATIAQEHGGHELGVESVCVFAEEFGSRLSTAPFSSSVYLVTEAIRVSGSEAQRATYLPRLADGSLIGCFSCAEGPGEPESSAVAAQVCESGCLTGTKWPVVDGMIAGVALVVAKDHGGRVNLYLADLSHPGVGRRPVETIDPTRASASLHFDSVPVARLGGDIAAPLVLDRLLERAAVFLAFEQIGGASRCLQMACSYANERQAFGRLIGSYQGIKHSLARIFVAVELARGNAYHAMQALGGNDKLASLAACAARISASDAFEQASSANVLVHGGMGFTWESDCHLYVRRAKLLSLWMGSTAWWKGRLAQGLME